MNNAGMLKDTIDRLSAEFAASIVAAMRSASLNELMSVTGSKPAATAPQSRPTGRRVRRTATDLAGTVDRVVALLQKNKDGLRAEQIRVALNIPRKDLPRPIADALSAGLIRKSGEKRSTTYFVKGKR